MKGFIQAQIHTGGGLDENGEPIPSQTYWGNNVECRYHANVLNNRGRYEDGEFTQSEYIITLFDMDFEANYIRLINTRGRVVCEKMIQSLEVLEDIQRVKITV